MFFKHNFIFEFAFSNRIEGEQAIDVDADQTIKVIEEEYMFDLIFTGAREDFVAVAD